MTCDASSKRDYKKRGVGVEFGWSTAIWGMVIAASWDFCGLGIKREFQRKLVSHPTCLVRFSAEHHYNP